MRCIKIVIILCFSQISIAQNTYIPDNNFEQALINLGFDTVLDDYVITANINTLTTLNISNLGIEDITGIEDFTDLVLLNVSNNNLTTLDISNNVFLGELACNSNSLTSLDVSNNTSLGILFINETDINTIDLSENTSLTWLDCSSTNLMSLDLSTNTALYRLYCENTSIINLDVSNNNILTEFYCVNNPDLTSLNIKNGNNQNVTFFNASNNPNLDCIEVDDEVYSNINWPDKDVTAIYSMDCSSLGILDVAYFNFKLYPNPTKNQFTIQLDNGIELINVNIYNNLGQLVLASKKATINASTLSAGLYIIDIETNKGKGVKKLIIQ